MSDSSRSRISQACRRVGNPPAFRWIRVLIAVAAVLVPLSCGGRHSNRGVTAHPPDSDKAPAGLSVLAGTVLRGPTSPIGTIGTSSAPMTGAKIILSRPGGGGAVTSTSSDAAGRYSVAVPAGSYVVTLGPLAGPVSTKDLPATVTLTRGQTTTLDIHIDTGIR